MLWKCERSTQVPGLGQSARDVSLGARCAFALCVLTFCAVLPEGVHAQTREQKLVQQYRQEIKKRNATLDSIKAELSRGRARVEELREREQSSLVLLRQIERNINVSERYLTVVAGGIDSLTAQIDVLGQDLAREETRLQERVAALRRRLAGMYRTGALEVAAQMSALSDPIESLRRVFYFRRLKAYDQSLIESIRASKDRIAQSKQSVESAREQQVRLLEEKRAEQQRLVNERGQRESVLRDVQAEREVFQARLDELEMSQKQLAMLLRQLEARKNAAAVEYERSLSSKFEKRKGKLGWPVEGTVSGTYGKVVHPVYKTVTMNNGVDITVKPGQPVRCVAQGKVAYVGRMRGLGRFLVVDHYGGYLTIYANLGAINVTVEDPVEYATILGQTASATAGGPATFHFEVRKSTEALNPAEWLEPRGAQ